MRPERIEFLRLKLFVRTGNIECDVSRCKHNDAHQDRHKDITDPHKRILPLSEPVFSYQETNVRRPNGEQEDGEGDRRSDGTIVDVILPLPQEVDLPGRPAEEKIKRHRRDEKHRKQEHDAFHKEMLMRIIALEHILAAFRNSQSRKQRYGDING